MPNLLPQNFGAFLQNTYTHAGLMGGGGLATAISLGVNSGGGTAAGLVALGGGAALMVANHRLNRMLQSGAPRPELPLTQRDIPDDVIRSHLSVELADRYAILGEPNLRPIRDKLVENIFNAWSADRLVDSRYPDLRGCVTESLIETEVAKVIAELQAGTTPMHVRVREGLQNDLGNRARRWAPLKVEDTAAARIKELYPAFEAPDCPVNVGKMAKSVYENWFKQGSPALMDKPGPAAPLLDAFVHEYVHGLMTFLASKPNDLKLTSLLRDLRRTERQRSMASSTLFSRLQKAGRELEVLSAYAGHLQFPNDTLKLQLSKTVEALRQAPEVMSKADLDRYAALEGLAGQESYVKDLAGRVNEVVAKAAEVRTKEDAGVRERLKWVQRVVAGTGAVAGLDAESIGSLHPVVPEWAQKVPVRSRDSKGAVTAAVFEMSPEGIAFNKALGLELQYRNGAWWLRDGRVLSRINSLLRRWNFTVNGQPVPGEGRWPVRPGDRVQDGSGHEIELALPEAPPLEKLRLPIARAASLQDLADLLKANGQRSLGQQIEDYLADGGAFTDIPQTGGLRAKLTDLVLRREAAILHEKYFLRLSYAEAEIEMAKIAQSVAASANVKELAAAVAVSSLPGAKEISQAILAAEAAGQDRNFEAIPTAFGIRERLILFLRENERVMRDHIGKLRGDVSRLSGELRNANAGIQGRDGLLTQSAQRESNLNAELQRARESLTAQERLAVQEKERLLAAQKAELARVAEAVQKLRNEHAVAVRAEQDKATAAAAEHARLQREKDAAHAEELTRKNDDMTRQAAEHKRLQDAKDQAHIAAVATLKDEHTKALGGKAAAYSALETAAREALAERDRLHGEKLDQLSREQTAALSAEARARATALETQRKDYETRLEQLEERRAETAAEVTRLEGELAKLAAEKSNVERVRDEKEALRAAAQAEVDRLTAEETRLNGLLSTSRATAGALQTQLEEAQRDLATKRQEVFDLTGERDKAQSQVNALEPQLETAKADNERLLKEELPRLEKTIQDLRAEARKIGGQLAEIDVAFAAMEDYLKIGVQIAGTDDYIKRVRLIKEALEARLAAAEAPVVDEAEIELEVDAAAPESEGPVTRVDIKLPAAAPAAPAAPAVKDKPTLTTSEMQRLKGPYFGNADPRTHLVEKFEVMGAKDLHSMDGHVVGQAWIRGGDLRDDTPFSQTYADGSILSAKTSIGVPKKPRPGEKETQEDGLYIASYRLPDGREVKIIAGADGAGGMGGGVLASSSFLQGIHAAVHQAAAEGRADLTAGELFEAGNEAVIFQKGQPGREKARQATGSAGIIVIIGNVATVASIGDATVVHGRKQGDGSYRVKGYSDVDHVEALGNAELRAQWNAEKVIIRGIGMKGESGTPHLYSVVVEPGDRFAIGSDGLHEHKAPQYKLNGSLAMRNKVGPALGKPVAPATRATWEAYERFFEQTAGTTHAGALLHDDALAAMQSSRNGHDNIFAISHEVGAVDESASVTLPAGYVPLETLWSPYIAGADPRTEPIQISVSGGLQLYNRDGALVGGAIIAAGGQEADAGFRLPDGSFISAQTSLGVPKPGKSDTNEDAFYTASFTMPDGTPVKVTAVADGAGRMGETGHVAPSAFLQGVQAAVADAVYAGRTDLTAEELFQAGIEAVEAQNKFGVRDPKERARLGVGDGKSCTTASVVLMIGNRAMVATYGDATVFYAVPLPSGGFRVVRYSNADYREYPNRGSDTSLIGYKPKRDDDDFDGSASAPLKVRRYLIDDVPDGAIFLTVSDGAAQALAGSKFPIHASEDMRSLGEAMGLGHIEPPSDNHLISLNRLLGLVSGHDRAAQVVHSFSKTMMEKALEDVTPVRVLNQDVAAPSRHKPIKDNLAVTVVQHRAGTYAPSPAPSGYGAMPEVVAVSNQPIPEADLRFRTDRKPGFHEKFLILGRLDGSCDELIPHGSVSRQHAYLAYNAEKNGNFEANTWYLQPISDAPEGTHVNGVKIEKGSWVALRGGANLRLGGVPLLVTVGGADHSLRLMTNTGAPAPRKSPLPPPLPPATPSPVPPPPVSMRNPSQPPAYQPDPKGSGGAVVMNGLDEVTLVSGSALDKVDTFALAKGKARSAHFIVETGLMGGDQYLRVTRHNGGLRVENPSKKKTIVVHPVGAPREGVEIKPGHYLDLAAPMFVASINGRVFRIQSE